MIIIATCDEWPDIGVGLRLIVDALTAQGQVVNCVPWQHADLDLFCQAKCVLPLCAWDYASSSTAFRRWIKAVNEGGGLLINSAGILLQNMKKTYLLELAERGINVTPTRYIENPSLEVVRSTQESEGWDDLVLKPVYGQSGNLVTRFSKELSADDAIFKSEEGILIQPFIREIKSTGELSLCFISGVFSHAVCRMPSKEDWRANTKFNVTVHPVELSRTVIDQAAVCLNHLDEMPLYARVDGTIVHGRFMLSELELIEPALFFDQVNDLEKTGFNRFLRAMGLS